MKTLAEDIAQYRVMGRDPTAVAGRVVLNLQDWMHICMALDTVYSSSVDEAKKTAEVLGQIDEAAEQEAIDAFTAVQAHDHWAQYGLAHTDYVDAFGQVREKIRDQIGRELATASIELEDWRRLWPM